MRNAAKPAEILAQNYSDSVADVLRSDGVNDDDIASVCDALKAQIFDIASQRGAATEDSVSQAIASMEDPSSFAAVEEHSNVAGNEAMQQLASLSFVTAISGPALAIVAGVLASFMGYEGWEFGSFILFSAASVALLFGIISRDNPKGRAAIKISLGTLAGYFALVLISLVFV